MSYKFAIAITGFVLLISIGNANGQNIPDSKKAKIEKQVDSIFHSMIQYAETLDYNKLSQGVDDSREAGFISNGVYYERYDSLVEIARTKSGGVTDQHITLQKEKVTVLSENTVSVIATGVSNVDLPDGNSFHVKFLWTFVYERINHQWKVIQSHQSVAR